MLVATPEIPKIAAPPDLSFPLRAENNGILHLKPDMSEDGFYNAGGGNRTRTEGTLHRILSPVRLPIPPLRHMSKISVLGEISPLSLREG